MIYNKVLLAHKAFYKTCPQYISSLIKKASNRYGSTKLIPPLPRIDLYKQCSFSYTGSATWNEIPENIRNIINTQRFKTALLKYLTS